MGKASRQRRQKKGQERQRERAARAGRGGEQGAGPRQPRPPGSGGPGTGPSQAEEISSLISAARRASEAGDEASFNRAVDQLTAERVPGWGKAVSRTLVDLMRLTVTQAWKNGWQPAELARHVGREATAAHASMVADVIVAEMRSYAAAAVDPRWAAQVASLPVTAPGADDGDYLGAWRAASGSADPTAPIATAAGVLGVLLDLPVLEVLLPIPGYRTVQPTAARPPSAASSAAGEGADERMLSRIRALLAKAESTEFEQEAEALSARAQELMAKYSIDHALLAARAGENQEPGGRRIAVDNPYEGPKTTLLNTVAEANRCRAIWSQGVGLVTVVGFPADLGAVELLFTSLLVQANTAMMRAGGRKDELGRSRTRAFRQSFLVSYAIRIGERLAEAATQAEREALAEQAASPGSGPGGAGQVGAGTDLVPFLAARREAVEDAVGSLFGDRLTRGRGSRVTDAEGWASGRAAADLASLNNRDAVAD
ncbi:MAG TPA: DUF2786 domain-containing protein [Trebonia sp.]|nr:DUF2786 domain-containing protein [Trebonia sp.]